MMKNHYLNSHAHLLPAAKESRKKRQNPLLPCMRPFSPIELTRWVEKSEKKFPLNLDDDRLVFLFIFRQERALTLCLRTHKFSDFWF